MAPEVAARKPYNGRAYVMRLASYCGKWQPTSSLIFTAQQQRSTGYCDNTRSAYMLRPVVQPQTLFIFMKSLHISLPTIWVASITASRLGPAIFNKPAHHNLTFDHNCRYMAPEVAACKPYIGKADVFGFGMITCETWQPYSSLILTACLLSDPGQSM